MLNTFFIGVGVCAIWARVARSRLIIRYNNPQLEKDLRRKVPCNRLVSVSLSPYELSSYLPHSLRSDPHRQDRADYELKDAIVHHRPCGGWLPTHVSYQPSWETASVDRPDLIQSALKEINFVAKEENNPRL